VDGNRRIELILAGYIGDRIVVVVQKQRAAGSEGTSTSLANKVRRGDIRHAVVVRVKKELQREDGTVVRFGDNACVLVNKSGDPIGTRMNGQWFLVLVLVSNCPRVH
jgi:ribosomal protein L14